MPLTELLFSFRGRINRLPYWIVSVVMFLFGGTLHQLLGGRGPEQAMSSGPGLLALLFFAVSVWIGLALQIKRWHDRDKSAWWALLNLVPVLGTIWILIECGLLAGSDGPNRFGRDPLQAPDSQA